MNLSAAFTGIPRSISDYARGPNTEPGISQCPLCSWNYFTGTPLECSNARMLESSHLRTNVAMTGFRADDPILAGAQAVQIIFNHPENIGGPSLGPRVSLPVSVISHRYTH